MVQSWILKFSFELQVGLWFFPLFLFNKGRRHQRLKQRLLTSEVRSNSPYCNWFVIFCFWNLCWPFLRLSSKKHQHDLYLNNDYVLLGILRKKQKLIFSNTVYKGTWRKFLWFFCQGSMKLNWLKDKLLLHRQKGLFYAKTF